jgi:hypothetical protein
MTLPDGRSSPARLSASCNKHTISRGMGLPPRLSEAGEVAGSARRIGAWRYTRGAGQTSALADGARTARAGVRRAKWSTSQNAPHANADVKCCRIFTHTLYIYLCIPRALHSRELSHSAAHAHGGSASWGARTVKCVPPPLPLDPGGPPQLLASRLG